MITVEGILSNLKQLISRELNEDDVICAFEDYKEEDEGVVDFDYLSNGNVLCTVDVAVPVNGFLLVINSDNIIVDVVYWRLH